MTWLAWRQFRAAALAGFAAVAALVAILAITGPGLADSYAAGLAECAAAGGDCDRYAGEFFRDNQGAFLAVNALMLLMPALIGLFWGAPLIARELETGTHRLVWNQSITRTRWLAVKLTLSGLAAVAAGGLASLAVTWWATTLDHAALDDLPPLNPLVFGARGIVPIAYAAFAFALGVTVGMLVRRTVAAMAVTILVFAALQFAVPVLVRPYLLPASQQTIELSPSAIDGIGRHPDGWLRVNPSAPEQGAWLLSGHTIDPSGAVTDRIQVSTTSGACSPSGPPQNFMAACLSELNRLGYRLQLTYHAPSRFWPFQWTESALYAALALGLAAFSFWHLRRRRT